MRVEEKVPREQHDAKGFTMKIPLYLALGASLCMSLSARAELILSGLPFEKDASVQNQHYTQLAAHLGQFLGESVRYVPALNMLGYAQDMRQGKYDILIDAPHFGAWRIAHGQHKPVVQADIRLTYVVVVPVADSKTRSLENLVSQPVCVSPPPQLSTLLFINQYPNPLQEPVMHMVDGYMPKLDKLFKGDCRAAVISAAFYENKLDKAIQAQLRVIFNTRPLPGYVMTVSPKVTERQRVELARHLSSANPTHDALLQDITRASVHHGEPEKLRWIAPDTDVINGLEQLLVKQSYGW